jgi:nicotinate-nucleotide adenylyltransferase
MSSTDHAGPARRVALYGGSFNPPHVGHVLCATLALCSGRFDEVRVLPVGDHAFGKALAPLAERVALLEAALAHLGRRVVVDPIEGELPTPSYTVRTVEHLQRQNPGTEFTLVVGADAFGGRHAWHRWEDLERLLGGRVFVVGRAGHAVSADTPIDHVLPDLSSTEIRRRVAAGEPFWWMVPEAVEAMIAARGLYR